MLTRRTLLRGGATAALAVTAGGLTGWPASASPATAPAGGPDRKALQAALDRMVATGATAALARFDGPSGRWAGAAGVARLDRPLRPRADGRFRVGSITKTFVATVTLQLVGQRRIALTDTVERWLPGALPNGAQVTVAHLLQHTSGVFNYTDTLFASMEEYLAIRYRSFTPRELVALAAAQPPLFEPGTAWSYSNTNYILLALIVERATGRPYGHQVARRILRPLGLRDTTIPGTALSIPGPNAHGYLPVEHDGQVDPLDITRLNPSVAWAAGEIISTTRDLNRFYGALLRGRLLRHAELRAMLSPHPETGYGFGIYRLDLPGGTSLWGHDGGIPGYVSLALSTEDSRSQLAVSVNPWIGDFGPALFDLVMIAFGGAPAPATSAPRRLPEHGRLPLLDAGTTVLGTPSGAR